MRIRYLEERRFVFVIHLHRVRIARGEGVALYFLIKIGRGTLYGVQLVPLYAKLGQGHKQRLCIRMARILEYFVCKAVFNYLTRVHNGNPVRNVCHNAEIVRDIYYGHIHFLLQPLYKVQYLRLHGNVQRGGGLVAD